MISIINKMVCFTLFIMIIAVISLFIKTKREADRKKNQFIGYLERKKDFQNLINFGFYNINGYKENRRVPLLDKIILEEYKSNKDEIFFEYAVYIKKISRNLILLFLLSFFLFCIFITIINIK